MRLSLSHSRVHQSILRRNSICTYKLRRVATVRQRNKTGQWPNYFRFFQPSHQRSSLCSCIYGMVEKLYLSLSLASDSPTENEELEAGAIVQIACCFCCQLFRIPTDQPTNQDDDDDEIATDHGHKMHTLPVVGTGTAGRERSQISAYRLANLYLSHFFHII